MLLYKIHLAGKFDIHMYLAIAVTCRSDVGSVFALPLARSLFVVESMLLGRIPSTWPSGHHFLQSVVSFGGWILFLISRFCSVIPYLQNSTELLVTLEVGEMQKVLECLKPLFRRSIIEKLFICVEIDAPIQICGAVLEVGSVKMIEFHAAAHEEEIKNL